MRGVLFGLVAFVIACAPAASAPPAPHILPGPVSGALAGGEDEVSLEVVELMCRPCAATIVQRSRALPGITMVSMTLATKTLTLRFRMSDMTRDRVLAAVGDIVAAIQ